MSYANRTPLEIAWGIKQGSAMFKFVMIGLATIQEWHEDETPGEDWVFFSEVHNMIGRDVISSSNVLKYIKIGVGQNVLDETKHEGRWHKYRVKAVQIVEDEDVTEESVTAEEGHTVIEEGHTSDNG